MPEEQLTSNLSAMEYHPMKENIYNQYWKVVLIGKNPVKKC